MKVTTETLERCEVLLTVEVEPKKEQRMLQSAAKRIAREVKIPGFRPGKAPYNVVVRRFGLEAIQQEAFEQAADQMIQEALEEAEIVPYARIQLESAEWSPLTVKVKVPTRPQVDLADYRDIRMEPEPVEVTDEDVEQSLTSLQEQTATWAPVDRPTEIGDLISIAVVEKDGDKILAEHESVEHELQPPQEHEGHNHPDLTTPLLGLSAGDEKTFTLDYPEDFGDDRYAGKEIIFDIEVLGVKEKEVDPIDDEFAKSVSDFETLDELRADIRSNTLQQRENQKNIELGNKVLDKIIEESKVEWPLAFEEQNVEQEIQRQERQMTAYGLTMESFLQMQGKTSEAFSQETREEVVNRLQRGLVIGKVAEQEKLEISESEILEQAKLIADVSGRGDQFWRDILASEAQQSMIANDLLINKTVERLAEIAKGEDPPIGLDNGSDEATQQAEADADSAVTAADESAEESEPSAAPADEDQDVSEDESAEEPAPTQA